MAASLHLFLLNAIKFYSRGLSVNGERIGERYSLYYMLRVHEPILFKKIDPDDVNKYTIGTLFKEMLQLESIQNPLVQARKAAASS